MKTEQRRADELKDGDTVILKASSITLTATGYVMVWLDGKLQTVPPDTMFTVVVEQVRESSDLNESHDLKTITDLALARATLDDFGGWLLNMGDGRYLRTDDEALVRRLRGDKFIAQCEAAQCWDETLRTA